MGLVDRINARIVARLRRDAPRVVVEATGLRIVGADGAARRLAFADLERATVHHRDVYTGDAIVLAMVFRGAARAEVFQDDPQWPALCEALDRLGRTADPSRVWQLQAIADGAGALPRDLLPNGQA